MFNIYHIYDVKYMSYVFHIMKKHSTKKMIEVWRLYIGIGPIYYPQRQNRNLFVHYGIYIIHV